jgi:hypothetical protein
MLSIFFGMKKAYYKLVHQLISKFFSGIQSFSIKTRQMPLAFETAPRLLQFISHYGSFEFAFQL